MTSGKQVVRVIISVVWLVASIVLGVGCVLVDHWLTHVMALICAFSTAASGYIVKQEWKLL